jgi:hypothetical protein
VKKGGSGGASGAKEKFAAFHAASSERTYERMVHLSWTVGAGGGYQKLRLLY